MSPKPPGVPADLYSREYYTTECQGYEEFFGTGGAALPLRLTSALELHSIEPGARVLDIGCGRGEFALHCARQGATVCGVDYSADALSIARELLDRQGENDPLVLAFQRADARRLPFPNCSFDLVYMLDIVEHLYPDELHGVFCEVARLLRPDGRLIIHTMPNTWYYRFGYPLYRKVQSLRGQRLPADPEERWRFVKQVHVNKQNPYRLRRALRAAGFEGRVWLQSVQSYEYEKNALARWGMGLATRLYPFRWIFCNDIFAVMKAKHPCASR